MVKKTEKKQAERGRPLKLDDEKIETIATALSNGLTRETAARLVKVSYQTFYDWRRKGLEERERRDKGEIPRKKDEIYLKFLNQIEEAETDAILMWQDTVNKAARTDPIWAMKMLQLRDPKGYSSQPITWSADIDLTKLNDEQLQRIANGEHPADVIANPGGSTPPPAKPASGQAANSG